MIKVLKEAEIPTDASTITKAWQDIKEGIIGKGFHQTMKRFLGEQVGTAAVATFGGTYGKVFAVAKEMGEILHMVSKPKRDFKAGKIPQRGEWVAIHNGRERMIAAARQLHSVSFGDAKTKAPVKLTRAISIGFCIGDGELPGGFKKIFNFETGHAEERHLMELIVLDQKHQDQLDSSPIWSKMKNIVLGTDAPPSEFETPTGGVPVDPGSEVVYDGVAYTIVDCDGNFATIKNSLKTLTVLVEKLSRGRVTHTNSHNYASNTLGSFNASSKAKFFKGQWVWLPPRALTIKIHAKAKWELGVVRLINESIVDGYYAIDGIRFQTHISQVTPCPKHDQDWMDTDRDFLSFKIAAVKGVNPKDYKLGRDHMLECLGIRTSGDAEVKHSNEPHEEPKKRLTGALGRMQNILEAGKRNERKYPNRPDDQAELKKTRVSAANTIQDSLNIPLNAAKRIVSGGGKIPQVSNEGLGNSDNSMIFIAVLVVATLAFLYSS